MVSGKFWNVLFIFGSFYWKGIRILVEINVQDKDLSKVKRRKISGITIVLGWYTYFPWKNSTNYRIPINPKISWVNFDTHPATISFHFPQFSPGTHLAANQFLDLLNSSSGAIDRSNWCQVPTVAPSPKKIVYPKQNKE